MLLVLFRKVYLYSSDINWSVHRFLDVLLFWVSYPNLSISNASLHMHVLYKVTFKKFHMLEVIWVVISSEEHVCLHFVMV